MKSALAMCDDTGYIGAVDLPTVQCANDLVVHDGVAYITDSSMSLADLSLLGKPQLVAIDLATKEVTILDMNKYNMIKPNAITVNPEGNIVVPDMDSELILVFDRQLNHIDTHF